MTHDKWAKMSSAEQRCWLAAHTGWTEIHPGRYEREGAPPEGRRPNQHVGDLSHYALPDYLNDLNAICDVVATLSTPMQAVYAERLADLCGYARDYYEGWAALGCFGVYEISQASAARRAEAFALTVGDK